MLEGETTLLDEGKASMSTFNLEQNSTMATRKRSISRIFDEDRTVDFTDTRITENTRGAYPIEFVHSSAAGAS